MEKKCFIMLLSAVLCLGRATAQEIVQSGTCGAEGDNLKWELTNDGTLTISGTGAMVADMSNAQPWKAHLSSGITAVVINDGVTYVGAEAFYNGDKITSVSLPASVTGIGEYAFGSCDDLPLPSCCPKSWKPSPTEPSLIARA